MNILEYLFKFDTDNNLSDVTYGHVPQGAFRCDADLNAPFALFLPRKTIVGRGYNMAANRSGGQPINVVDEVSERGVRFGTRDDAA